MEVVDPGETYEVEHERKEQQRAANHPVNVGREYLQEDQVVDLRLLGPGKSANIRISSGMLE